MLVSHLGYWSLHICSLPLAHSLSVSHTHRHTRTHAHILLKSPLFQHSYISAFFCMYENTHTHTPDYRAIISSGVNLIVQPSLSICPAMLHHDVVSQIHKRQNNVKKNIFIRIIYQNSKLYNCTIVQIAQMCTCGSLIYRYYVPVTLFFKCFFLLFELLFVKRGTTKWKRLYYIVIIMIIILDFLHRCSHWWKDSCTFSWAYSEGCVFCPVNSPWSVLRCRDAYSLLRPETPLYK